MISQSQDALPNDNWLTGPYLCLAPYPIVILAIYAFNLEFAGIFLLPAYALLGLGLFVVMPFVARASYRANRKRRALSAILIPALVLAVVASTPFDAWLGDRLCFYRMHHSLQQDVDRNHGDDARKLMIWVTGGFLSAAHGYVYDGSDEVALPAGHQSESWKKRAYQTELEDSCFDAEHITGHYYSFSTTHGC